MSELFIDPCSSWETVPAATGFSLLTATLVGNSDRESVEFLDHGPVIAWKFRIIAKEASFDGFPPRSVETYAVTVDTCLPVISDIKQPPPTLFIALGRPDGSYLFEYGRLHKNREAVDKELDRIVVHLKQEWKKNSDE